MFDFYFGTDEEIEADEEKYLLSIKRMLPKWCNSIPDSEYIALFRLCEERARECAPPIIVETGVGASTIVLAFCAMKHFGILYSWDISGEKGSYLKSVMVDTICKYFKLDINEFWKFIAYNSGDSHLGIPVIKELEIQIDFSFHDSKHTLLNLMNEIDLCYDLYADGAIIAIDDGSYTNFYENFSYINILRKKLGLDPVENPDDNICAPFHMEIEESLKLDWESVEHIDDDYKKMYKEDMWFKYFANEFDEKVKFGMEVPDTLEHRFDAWRVNGRIQF